MGMFFKTFSVKETQAANPHSTKFPDHMKLKKADEQASDPVFSGSAWPRCEGPWIDRDAQDKPHPLGSQVTSALSLSAQVRASFKVAKRTLRLSQRLCV